EGARRDARLLLAAALDAGPELPIAHPERVLNGSERARIERLIARRAAREPVSRILGRRGFWSLDFKITPDTLDPRPDSETLIEAVLGRIDEPAAPLHILDLGTGCGCLLLALLSELPAARGLGVDISEAALGVARENADSLGLGARARFERRDWAAGLSGPWQVIISNPPYIREREIEELAPEVAHHDPEMALNAGLDGLDAYRALLPRAGRLLDRGGILALEVGKGQQDAVEALLVATGLTPLGRVRDLGGIERCLVATLGNPWNSAKK
ncbi:MAG: peptide chain release factor N(5)-glutamine methyltransferase, partial [Proteobacteria bacterium]|nr:peptide chain release factor N(5)-glutamine methyltransferase [Pseudomonadota bacterium]